MVSPRLLSVISRPPRLLHSISSVCSFCLLPGELEAITSFRSSLVHHHLISAALEWMQLSCHSTWRHVPWCPVSLSFPDHIHIWTSVTSSQPSSFFSGTLIRQQFTLLAASFSTSMWTKPLIRIVNTLTSVSSKTSGPCVRMDNYKQTALNRRFL